LTQRKNLSKRTPEKRRPAKRRTRAVAEPPPRPQTQVQAPTTASPGRREAMRITLPPDYKPSDKEQFMNPVMLEYFRQKLLRWRTDLLSESNETLQNLQQGSILEPDFADRASTETDRSIELRTRDRARKLIAKIDEALQRVEEGGYGYCEETGEPISLPRLEARPIATMSLEAQERHERMEKVHRDD
jgi:DnaK suppressor protein